MEPRRLCEQRGRPTQRRERVADVAGDAPATTTIPILTDNARRRRATAKRESYASTETETSSSSTRPSSPRRRRRRRRALPRRRGSHRREEPVRADRVHRRPQPPPRVRCGNPRSSARVSSHGPCTRRSRIQPPTPSTDRHEPSHAIIAFHWTPPARAAFVSTRPVKNTLGLALVSVVWTSRRRRDRTSTRPSLPRRLVQALEVRTLVVIHRVPGVAAAIALGGDEPRPPVLAPVAGVVHCQHEPEGFDLAAELSLDFGFHGAGLASSVRHSQSHGPGAMDARLGAWAGVSGVSAAGASHSMASSGGSRHGTTDALGHHAPRRTRIFGPRGPSGLYVKCDGVDGGHSICTLSPWGSDARSTVPTPSMSTPLCRSVTFVPGSSGTRSSSSTRATRRAACGTSSSRLAPCARPRAEGAEDDGEPDEGEDDDGRREVEVAALPGVDDAVSTAPATALALASTSATSANAQASASAPRGPAIPHCLTTRREFHFAEKSPDAASNINESSHIYRDGYCYKRGAALLSIGPIVTRVTRGGATCSGTRPNLIFVGSHRGAASLRRRLGSAPRPRWARFP